ncbi:hypothetical protein ACMHYB_14975 [Sorangium sp. So ce1128]
MATPFFARRVFFMKAASQEEHRISFRLPDFVFERARAIRELAS